MARPIGELFQYVIARAERMMEFQEYLGRFHTREQHRAAIYFAHRSGFLSDSDLVMILDAYEFDGVNQ